MPTLRRRLCVAVLPDVRADMASLMVSRPDPIKVRIAYIERQLETVAALIRALAVELDRLNADVDKESDDAV